MQAITTNPSPQSVLIEMNLRSLREVIRLLERLDDAAYSTAPRDFAPQSAGRHLRHIVEFYQCFFEGLPSSHIDYDARRCDRAIERSRDCASAAIQSIIRLLETHSELRHEGIVWVRVEDAESSGVRENFMQSSISRELQMLSSHTVHHFASIAMTLRMHGVRMDPDFGMAPSTLRYLASRTAEAA
jgi:uncharacterized damage-inducible protein DinB